ncbi:MAG: Uma2 family endonuclease [Bryobacteraceae bacterium]
MTEDEFFDFCASNPGLRIERTARGEIIIMPPAGFETGFRNNDLCRQLGNWAKADGRGVALDSNTEYVLPNGAALSPDASWVSKSRLEQFTKEQKRRFLPLCPDFVIELLSPSDRLKTVKAKMEEWIDNGVDLGWLIDADSKTVYIYRPGQPPTELAGAGEIVDEGPVAGFRLDLRDVWQGV